MELNEAIQNGIQALVTILAVTLPLLGLGAVFARIVVWVKGEFERIRNEQPDVIRDLIDAAVMLGASFAEKVDLAGMLEQYGRDKKTLALNAARDWLLAQGYDVDLSLLDAALENILFQNPDEFPSSRRDSRG